MYSEFYNLRGSPFRLNPDHRFFFVAEPHEKAIAHLKYALNRNEGFVVITGEVGAGKTTLVNRVLSELEESRYITGNIVTSFIEHEELISLVAAIFGIDTEGKNKASLLLGIRSFLEEERVMGRRPILFVDEVQNLPDSSLEELRMLSNFSLPGESLLQIFLVGQPEFRETLADESLEQLRQRVVTSCHLGTLGLEDTRSYILHRLKLASWSGDPAFSERSFGLIQRLSGGVPRRINVICDRLLLHGFLEELHRIDSSVVAAVARDMTDEGLLTAPDDVLDPDAPPASSVREPASVVRLREDPARDNRAVVQDIPQDDHEVLTEDMTNDLEDDDTLLLEKSQKVATDAAAEILEGEPEGEGTTASATDAPEALGDLTKSKSGDDTPKRNSASEQLDEIIEAPVQAEIIPLHRRKPALGRYGLAAAVVLAVATWPGSSLLRQDTDTSNESAQVSLEVESDRNIADAPLNPEIIPAALTASDDKETRENDYLLPASNASHSELVQGDPAKLEKLDGDNLEIVMVSPKPLEEAGQGSLTSLPSVGPESLLKPDISRLSEKLASSTEDLFLIQLVALRSADEAKRLHAQFEERFVDLLSSYELGVQEAQIAGTQYFRVMTGVAGDRAKMTEICARIREGDQDCILVLDTEFQARSVNLRVPTASPLSQNSSIK